jgi:hypothetical protein
MVEVDMNAEQEAKYDRYVQEIEKALDSESFSDKGKILGLLARMALVAIHHELDEGYDWKTAQQAVTDGTVKPASPKLDACAERVAANRTCGHIIFVDNVAVHAWMRDVLVMRGVQKDRIAILNATMAKASADRQRIADEFNGNAEEGLAPKYDVVIANAVAYEGVNLQKRTCAIHHLDLPWEPATLQQRNGRGVRQGNTLGAIEIDYYFSRRSQDGLRFNLIQGKLGWMTDLIKSQARGTNNPGAQMNLGPEDVLLLISRDPAKTAARLAEVKAAREAAARKKVAEDAARMLRSANARFRKAEHTPDPVEAARLRLEGEARLQDLASVDPAAWPWAGIMGAVRTTNVMVPPGGECPVYEGLRIGLPNPWNPDKTDFVEFGRFELEIATRESGSARWNLKTAYQIALLNIGPEALALPWPEDDERQTQAGLDSLIDQQLRYSGSWPSLGWHMASDAWLVRTWPYASGRVFARLAEVRDWYTESQRVPALVQGSLVVGRGRMLAASGTEILPPTLAGWRAFLDLAPASGLKFTELEEIGTYWWSRRIPRDLLSRAKREAEVKAADAEEAA